jgi:hypothetical protein
MHRIITIAILGFTLLTITGCGHGPLRRFFRGGACNACQPAVGQTLWGQDTEQPSSCPNGMCGKTQPAETLSGAAIGSGTPGTIEGTPANSGVIYGQPSFDPFSGGQIVNPPASGDSVLPRPR